MYAWTQGGSRRGGAVFKCPSAWRLSHSLSAPGSMQTDFRPSCRSSLSLASNSYLVFFAPVFVRISGAHLLFPFSDTSRVNLRRSLFFVGLFAQTCSYSVHFVVSALTCGVERLVSADIIPLHYFCQARLLLRNLSPYLQQKRQEGSGTEASGGFSSAVWTLALHLHQGCCHQRNYSSIFIPRMESEIRVNWIFSN